MTLHKSARAALHKANVIVIKIGSRALSQMPDLFAKLAGEIAESQQKARRFVIVSSGAIALGYPTLGYRRRPKEIAQLQAAAAVGQSTLMRRWADAFLPHQMICAQVLLTHADLADRTRLNHARRALRALHDARAIPIINENDTVATDEILRFGDNDQLASMVVPLVGADLLLLLTDVSGVLDEHGQRISVLEPDVSVELYGSDTNAVGSGGISSKVSAARKSARSGATTVIANASEPELLSRLLAGEDLGTLVSATETVLRARKHWILYTLRPKGTVLIDPGAGHAIGALGKSLLPIGVLGVRGVFQIGDAVSLVTADGREVARGLSRMNSQEVARTAGRGVVPGPDLEPTKTRVVVHRDDMVRVDDH